MEKVIFRSKKQTAIINTITITKKIIIVKIINLLIKKEKTALSDNTRIIYGNICENYSYILNNPIPKLTKL